MSASLILVQPFLMFIHNYCLEVGVEGIVLDLILLGWPIQAIHAFTLCLRRVMTVRLVSTVFKSIVICLGR
jgi:hypothetical protein